MLWKFFNLLFLLMWKLVACNASYRSAAYYVNWAIYARKFNPQDLPVDHLTHVLYAFANISPSTGEVYLSDTWADTEIHFAGDSWGEAGTNLYGCFKQLYILKKANRNLKVLLSIGGSSYSTNFAIPASTDSGRSIFASSAVSLVANLGLDGLDIDWEYPQNDAEAGNMVLLLQAIREALDTYGSSLSTPYHFQLTVACPAGPSYYQTLHLADMDLYVDFWNLMAYDYAGSWSSIAANQANLFPSSSEPASTPFNTEDTIGNYTAKGIAASKINLGMPIYGRSFAATDGLGQPFSGVGQGTWQAGVYDFKALPISGAIDSYDNNTGSNYCYDITSKELVSYDDVSVAKQKAAFIQQMGLGGAMWWESSADKAGNDSLIQNVVTVLSGIDGSGLENSPNQLFYPNSTYDNIQAGIPGSDSASTVIASSTTSEAASSLSVKQDSDISSRSSIAFLSTSEVDFSPSSFTAPTQFTTSTVRATSVSTIISCASTVENCPAHSTVLTTLTIDISTTICPVSETSQPTSVSASSTYVQSFSETNLAIQSTINISIDIVSSSLTALSCSELGSTATTISIQYAQSYITSTLVIPGEDGVAACAYVLASDLGAGALCLSDYCNCDGTIAPLLTSSISGTLATNCNYETQPAANSCPSILTSSSASPEALYTSTTTTTLPGPIYTVTSMDIVAKRDGVCLASTSILKASDTIIANSDSVFILSSSLISPTTISGLSSPNSDPASSLSATSISKSSSNSTSVISSSSMSSISSPLVTSRNLSSYTSPLLAASISSISCTSPQILSSTLSSLTSLSTSISSPSCVISGHCNTYKLLACPDGDCFCGQDINNEPTCFKAQSCHNLRECSSDADCVTDEACGVKDCCGNGTGRCLRRVVGCMDSPAKMAQWYPSLDKKRGAVADTEV